MLLILAGVAISLTIGQNGIITRAQTAVVINENASIYEQLQLKIADYQLEKITNNTESEILTRLKEDGYVHADNSVNVENLMGRRMQTGNGSIADGDVYVLEKRQETASSVTSDEIFSLKYYLIYYGENNSTNTNLGLAFAGKIEEEFYEPTDESYFEFDEETGGIALKDSGNYYGNELESRNIGQKTIVIPSKYNGRSVTKVGIIYEYEAAGIWSYTLGINALDVEKIIMPNSVTEIIDDKGNNGGFYCCKGLKEITLSKNLKKIGNYSFSLCSSLEMIEIPDSVEKIGNEAFKYCSSLTTITIPAKVKNMGYDVFEGCTALETIEVAFNKEEEPEGWDSNWSNGCNAKIVYADGTEEQL